MTETAMGLMTGKRGLIMGLANDKSIAWGIAKAVADEGAELAFSYQGEQLLKRVKPLAEQVGSSIVLPCDVGDAESLDALFAALEAEWGSLDFVVHAIGFSDKNELRGRYVDTSPANFAMTMDISVYSFTAVCQRAEKMMPNGGSLLTLTYSARKRSCRTTTSWAWPRRRWRPRSCTWPRIWAATASA
jgi:enoyl-[acyl-carrier protein] reductase I